MFGVIYRRCCCVEFKLIIFDIGCSLIFLLLGLDELSNVWLYSNVVIKVFCCWCVVVIVLIGIFEIRFLFIIRKFFVVKWCMIDFKVLVVLEFFGVVIIWVKCLKDLVMDIRVIKLIVIL